MVMIAPWDAETRDGMIDLIIDLNTIRVVMLPTIGIGKNGDVSCMTTTVIALAEVSKGVGQRNVEDETALTRV